MQEGRTIVYIEEAYFYPHIYKSTLAKEGLMKKLFIVLSFVLILCFMISCQDKEAMAELEELKAQAAVEEQNIALIKRHYDAWNSGDVEVLRGIFSPDYVYHSRPGQDVSFEQMIGWLKPQIAAFPDRVFSVEDILAKGDKVVSRFIFKGTHEGEVEGLPPATGKKFEIIGIEIWRVEEGKIVESWDVHDNLSLYQQLGMEMKPKEEK
jgi:steroid delta-isomerase-like uncharacterized protein